METNYEAWLGDTVYPLIVVVVTEVLMVFAPGGHNIPLLKEYPAGTLSPIIKGLHPLSASIIRFG